MTFSANKSKPLKLYPRNGVQLEVRIGVTDSPREITFQSSLSPGDIESQILKALEQGVVALTLSDEKGRRFIIPTRSFAYAEIAAGDERRVGFIA